MNATERALEKRIEDLELMYDTTLMASERLAVVVARLLKRVEALEELTGPQWTCE